MDTRGDWRVRVTERTPSSAHTATRDPAGQEAGLGGPWAVQLELSAGQGRGAEWVRDRPGLGRSRCRGPGAGTNPAREGWRGPHHEEGNCRTGQVGGDPLGRGSRPGQAARGLDLHQGHVTASRVPFGLPFIAARGNCSH